MDCPRKDSVETCLRLIEAACKVFSKKSFKDARISDICTLAGVNGALVNYHFGNKKNLYCEAWLYAHRRSQDTYPLYPGPGVDCSPRERFRIHVDAMLRRMFEGGFDFAIMRHEMTNPTGFLAETMKKELRPMHENLDNIIRELLGSDAPEQQIQFCHASIMGQCFHFMVTLHKRPPRSNDAGPFLIDDIDAYIDHVVAFSLAGMKHIRAHHTAKQTYPDPGTKGNLV